MKNAMSNMLKTKSGRWVKLPTDEENETIQATAIADPDAPLLTDEQMAGVQPLRIYGNRLVKEQKNIPPSRKSTCNYLNKGELDA